MGTEEKGEPVLSPEQGLRIILESTPVLGSVEMELDQALGLVVAQEIVSGVDVPPFANSAMDGFAVRAADTAGAEPDRPVLLRIIGRAPAGAPFAGRVEPGEAVEIMTGAPIPDGADAVVRVESTSFGRDGWGDDSRNGSAHYSRGAALGAGDAGSGTTVAVYARVEPGTAVRAAGTDARRGSVVVEQGTVVTPAVLGLLASCGITRGRVGRRPRVALCVGGDEVVPAREGVRLAPGQIFDSNSPMLRALIRSWGVEVDFLGRLPDDPPRMREVFERGLAYDYLVTVGGVSMGRYDHVRRCLSDLGAEEIFWRLNQQPGGPLLFARHGSTLIFGLPGNPVSCYVCAELYLRASLRRAAGLATLAQPVLRASLSHDLRKSHGKTAFLRGWIMSMRALTGTRGGLAVATTGPQDSNLIRSVTGHHGYIVFPAKSRHLAAGETVEFLATDVDAVARVAADVLGPASEVFE